MQKPDEGLQEAGLIITAIRAQLKSNSLPVGAIAKLTALASDSTGEQLRLHLEEAQADWWGSCSGKDPNNFMAALTNLAAASVLEGANWPRVAKDLDALFKM